MIRATVLLVALSFGSLALANPFWKRQSEDPNDPFIQALVAACPTCTALSEIDLTDLSLVCTEEWAGDIEECITCGVDAELLTSDMVSTSEQSYTEVQRQCDTNGTPVRDITFPEVTDPETETDTTGEEEETDSDTTTRDTTSRSSSSSSRSTSSTRTTTGGGAENTGASDNQGGAGFQIGVHAYLPALLVVGAAVIVA